MVLPNRLPVNWPCQTLRIGRAPAVARAATLSGGCIVNSEAIDRLQPTRSGGAVQSEPVPCSVNRRLLAFAIDSVALSVCIFTAAMLSWMTVGAAISFDLTQPGPDNGLLADPSHVRITTYVSTIVSLCYFVGSWMLLSASPGQRLMGIRVLGAATNAPLTLSQALGRWVLLGAPLWILSTAMPNEIGAVLTAATLAWSIFLLATTARSPGGQGAHDRWTESMVADVSHVALGQSALRLVKPDVR